MLIKPRLALLEAPQTMGDRLRRASAEALFGIYPAALHVMEPKTKLDRRGYLKLVTQTLRGSQVWDKPHIEMFSAFVSYLNQCRF